MAFTKSILILAYSSNDFPSKAKNDLEAHLIAQFIPQFITQFITQWNFDLILSWYDNADLETELSKITNQHENIYILPIFMCEGFVMGKTMKEITHSLSRKTSSPITVLPPIGSERTFAELIIHRSQEISRQNNLALKELPLVLVAHGSHTYPYSSQATQELAERIRSKAVFLKVFDCYLEQSPHPRDIIKDLSGSIILEGLFLSDGNHLREDVPASIEGLGDSIYRTPAGGLVSDPYFRNIVDNALEAFKNKSSS